jgi:hypothetical protein
MKTLTSRIIRASLCAVVVLTAVVVPAGTAVAHWAERCHEENHDSNQGSAVTHLDHPGGGSYPFHRGVSSVEYWFSSCSSGAGHFSEPIDQYIATYADNLISGSWHNGCSSKIKGWEGNANDDWIVTVANGTWYTGTGSCTWGTYTLRTRAIQKTQYVDGHVITSTAVNDSHPHI